MFKYLTSILAGSLSISLIALAVVSNSLINCKANIQSAVIQGNSNEAVIQNEVNELNSRAIERLDNKIEEPVECDWP